MKYEMWHWRVHNVQRRIFGLMAVVAGATFSVTALLEMVGRMPPWYGDRAWAYIPVGAMLAVVGIVLCRRRTYRPDLGDVSWWAGKAGGYDAHAGKAGEPRSWWTGEPKRRDARLMPNER